MCADHKSSRSGGFVGCARFTSPRGPRRVGFVRVRGTQGRLVRRVRSCVHARASFTHARGSFYAPMPAPSGHSDGSGRVNRGRSGSFGSRDGRAACTDHKAAAHVGFVRISRRPGRTDGSQRCRACRVRSDAPCSGSFGRACSGWFGWRPCVLAWDRDPLARPARSNALDVMSVGRKKPSPTVVVQPSKISRERRFFDLSFST